jgi:hypothetical protein
MEPLIVETAMDVRDWDALQAYVQGRMQLRRGSRLWQQMAPGILLGISGLVGYIAADLLDLRVNGLSILVGVSVGLIAFLVMASRQAKFWRPKPGSSWFRPTHYAFDASGIRATGDGQVGLVEWRSIDSLDETPEHVFFAVSEFAAYIIPKRAIGAVTPAEFVAQVSQWYANRATPAPGNTTAVPEGPLRESASAAAPASADPAAIRPPTVDASPADREAGFWHGLLMNLRAGMRIFFLRKVPAGSMVSTFDQVAALFAIVILLSVLLDWLRAPANASFAFYSVYAWFVWILVGFWTCALIARCQTPHGDTRAVLIAALSVSPWPVTALWGLSQVPLLTDDDSTFTLVTVAILLPVAFAVARAVTGYLRLGTIAAVLLCLLGAGLLNEILYLDTKLWEESTSYVEDAQRDRAAAESLLFDQPELIDDATLMFEPERPGAPDVYFVGFAGDGSQRVFRREALFGQKVFAERMGSGARSIALINDVDDRIKYPLGSISGLRRALINVGTQMDNEDDILVLLLTSHGSQESGISVDNGRLPLNDVDPEAVQRAFEASGIQWRIVIVSACYAGVFIEPLKNANTMVITAADADNTSFGCADDRDLTYFGEAFLRDALPKAESLETAFDTARQAIRKRERAEKLTPSNPQIFVGEAMRRKLAQLGKFPLPAAPAEAVTTRAGLP